ncbi:hypothetical protein SANTM175S_08612 [Streptomyces antimycoticus]
MSGYATRREQRLRAALEADGRRLRVHGAVVTAVETGEVTPDAAGGLAVLRVLPRWRPSRATRGRRARAVACRPGAG